MRIRTALFKDYGISQDQATKLRKWCRNATPEQQALILQCCQAARPDMATILFFSITQGVGYDVLSRAVYIPLSAIDFYGYQRLAFSKIYERINYEGNTEL